MTPPEELIERYEKALEHHGPIAWLTRGIRPNLDPLPDTFVESHVGKLQITHEGGPVNRLWWSEAFPVYTHPPRAQSIGDTARLDSAPAGEAVAKLRAILADFDAEVADVMASDSGERADLWEDIDVPVSLIRAVLSRPTDAGSREIAMQIACSAFDFMPNYSWGEHTTDEVHGAIQTAAYKTLMEASHPTPPAEVGGTQADGLVERYAEQVRVARAYAIEAAKGAPTSTFEIMVQHFAGFEAEFAAALVAAEAKVLALTTALRAMLQHSCVADTAAEDKDIEDHDAERIARAALEQAHPNEMQGSIGELKWPT